MEVAGMKDRLHAADANLKNHENSLAESQAKRKIRTIAKISQPSHECRVLFSPDYIKLSTICQSMQIGTKSVVLPLFLTSCIQS
jgi:hypothetical protein